MDKSEDRGFRILFVMDSLFTGGAEFSTLTLAGWLKKQGKQVQIICLKHKDPSYVPADFDLEENVLTLKGVSVLAKLKELNSHISRFRPHIVHSVLLNSNLLCRASSLFHRQPVYVESLVNRTYDKARFKDRNVNRGVLRLYQLIDTLSHGWGTDHFHAVTHDIASHFNRKTRIRAGKIEVVHRGRNSNPWVGNEVVRREVRKELGIGDRDFVFLNIGRHEYQKGQLSLLESFLCFREKQEHSSVLLIAGREGHESANLKNFLQQHSLEKSVRLLGHREDVQKLLIASDVFVLPSVFEGIGGVLIEAEAAGLPVICSDLDGLREVVVPDGNALLVRPADVKGLCSAMVWLARDPLLRKQFGEKSLQIFGEKFEMEISHQRMDMFYRRVILK